MPTNTIYRPARVGDFDASKLRYNAQGVKATISVNTTTNLDLYFTDDHLLTGFWLIGSGINSGDYVTLQVIDTDNIMGFGAGTVLNTFANNIYLPASFNEQFDVAYPAKIFAGLSIRVIYHSTLLIGVAPAFMVNYKLHKVLV